MNRKIIGVAKDANASFIGATPHSTQSIGPNKDVTGIGTGSVIHHIATKAMIANKRCSGASKPAIGENQIAAAQAGPNRAPTICRV